MKIRFIYANQRFEYREKQNIVDINGIFIYTVCRKVFTIIFVCEEISMTKRKRKFNFTLFCMIIGSILILYLIFALLPRTQCVESNPFVVEKGTKPLLIAHGGGHGEFPDNTLEACYNAYSVDSEVMLEMDVSITKDGEVIMSHDVTLDRRTNASGAIADWNYTDLMEQKVDFSYVNKLDENGKCKGNLIKFTNEEGKAVTPQDVEYPQNFAFPQGIERDDTVFLATKLTDVLTCFPNNTVNVEIKQDGETGKRALLAVVKIMEDFNAFDRIVLASFHSEIYKEIKNIRKTQHPDILCSPEYVGVGTLLISGALKLDALYNQPVAVLQIPPTFSFLHLDRKWFIETAHSHNIAVHFWTIDDADEMRALIEIGADGIMTNYPHLLKQVYDEIFPA